MEFTDKDYWADYWKKYTPFVVRKDILFSDLLDQMPDGDLSCLEIGGFPGSYCIYMHQYKHYASTLLDFYINDDIMNRTLQLNAVEKKDIEVIQGNVFEVNIEKQFDLVMSFGFIEHFSDTEAILKKHFDFLKKGGSFLITLPNLKGLLGKITKKFDYDAFITHNLESMDIAHLKDILRKTGVAHFDVFYYGPPYLYINSNADPSDTTRALVSTLSSIMCKTLPKVGLHRNKWFSPNIVIIGKK